MMIGLYGIADRVGRDAATAVPWVGATLAEVQVTSEGRAASLACSVLGLAALWVRYHYGERAAARSGAVAVLKSQVENLTATVAELRAGKAAAEIKADLSDAELDRIVRHLAGLDDPRETSHVDAAQNGKQGPCQGPGPVPAPEQGGGGPPDGPVAGHGDLGVQ